MNRIRLVYPFLFHERMKALITGGTGFIGSHLADMLLEDGYSVSILKRQTSNIKINEQPNLQYIIGDLLDKKSLIKACDSVDSVFHVAAIPRDWETKKNFYAVNFDGTKNLLDACVENKIKCFVYMSSAAVYGFPKTNKPIPEDYPLHPIGHYGKTKYLAEQLLWRYGHDHDMVVTSVRSPMVIGPRDTMIVPFILSALKQNKFFFIGDGQQQISMSDGRDVAHCLKLAGETNTTTGKAYNVTSYDCTPQQLIQTIVQEFDVSFPTKHHSYHTSYLLACILEAGAFIFRNNPPLTRYKVRILGNTRLIDSTKAKQQLNYMPEFTYQTTVHDMIQWFLAHQKKK